MPSRDAAQIRTQDWAKYLARGGEIERTVIDTCDACDATCRVHVIGPFGGVLAFCADAEACAARQRSAG